MDHTTDASARRIAQGINVAERRNASSFETSVQLMQDILVARRQLGKEPTFGAASLRSLASATLKFAEGMEHLATCHHELRDLQHEAGLTIAYGDLCPFEAQIHPLSAVA